ncbi:MAG: ferrous iron transport protein B [Planctomycetia bacterium]|nr:ferrous iron transport protein B [Planctomycetia bacterium]
MIPRAHCASGQCPAHRAQQLVKLGVSMERFDYVVALAGNPNTGKSTVFNAITGLRQHTGNWPGKTVTRAEGAFSYGESRYKLVDLPGTYSLMAATTDEEVARNFILFGQPDVTLIVVDAARLERNLNLVLQVLEITDRAVLCLNLVDEARRHRITVDEARLSEELGIPVVATSARYGEGIPRLLEVIHQVATGQVTCAPRRLARHDPTAQEVVDQLSERLESVMPGLLNPRWVALRLLDGDKPIAEAVESGELVTLFRPDQTDATPSPADREPVAAEPAAPAAASRDDVVALASSLRWTLGPNFHQSVVEAIYTEAAGIADRCVTRDERRSRFDLDATLDRLVTSRWLGMPLMILMLAVVLWITVSGANVPSSMLSDLLLGTVYRTLTDAAAAIGMPWWLDGLLIDGMYMATAWVVAVMLPPMAIFFPLFTLLEDFGYLPRVAFNLDSMFRRAGAHGKQALTMCMGFGCNAAGVVATRVIDSPRERLIAIITNNFSLCNGRWPTQIMISAIFLGALAPPYLAGLVSAAAVVGVALLGVAMMFLVSWALSRTVLRGEASTFSLELPPYRPPKILQTLYTSLVDRTLFVLWRAVMFAMPAGAAIWLVANVHVGGVSLAKHFVDLTDTPAAWIGLNGVILLAYIVAIPANEIVIPTVLMLTVVTTGVAGVGHGAGVMFVDTETTTAEVLQAGGWTVLTGVNLMLFSLLHNPCSTTIYTIYRETGSVKWTLLATLLPLAMGMVVCFVVAQIWPLFS